MGWLKIDPVARHIVATFRLIKPSKADEGGSKQEVCREKAHASTEILRGENFEQDEHELFDRDY